MAASNFLEESILNYFFRKQSVPQPTNLYLALYINDPTDSDTGTEVTGSGYTRQQITFGTPTQSGGKAVITNNQKIEYAIAGSGWGNVSHWAIHSASTGGNMLTYGAFSATNDIKQGNRVEVGTSNLEISMS